MLDFINYVEYTSPPVIMGFRGIIKMLVSHWSSVAFDVQSFIIENTSAPYMSQNFKENNKERHFDDVIRIKILPKAILFR